MHIAYAAHTDACTFYLDDDGICRRVLRRRADAATGEKAERCLGAQYVASLDASSAGGLVAMPRVGVPMLFAYVGDEGRIALVRTGPVQRFEEHGTPDDRPSQRLTRPTLPDDAPSRPDSGVRVVPDDDANDAPRTLSDRTAEMRAMPILDFDDDADTRDGASTQLFRSTKPPTSPRTTATSPRTTATPIPERPSWMPPTRVERVSIVPAPPSRARMDAAPATDRDPPTSRQRGVLPARAARGRG